MAGSESAIVHRACTGIAERGMSAACDSCRSEGNERGHLHHRGLGGTQRKNRGGESNHNELNHKQTRARAPAPHASALPGFKLKIIRRCADRGSTALLTAVRRGGYHGDVSFCPVPSQQFVFLGDDIRGDQQLRANVIEQQHHGGHGEAVGGRAGCGVVSAR